MDKSDFVAILLRDVDDSIRRQKSDDSQTNRRHLVRSLFAALEGISWLFLNHILAVLESMDMLEPEEDAAVSEVTYFINDAGKISSQYRYLSVHGSIRFAARMATKADPQFAVDFGSQAWVDLTQSTGIRNRITHPKSASDIDVSDTDLSKCLSAFYWLLDTATDAMEASSSALQIHLQDAKQVLADLKNGDPATWAEYIKAQAKLKE